MAIQRAGEYHAGNECHGGRLGRTAAALLPATGRRRVPCTLTCSEPQGEQTTAGFGIED